MSKECLKTQLPGIVENDKVIRLGEMRITVDVYVADKVQLNLIYANAVEVSPMRIVGKANFYSKEGASLGKEVNITGGFNSFIIKPDAANTKYYIFVPQKYSITRTYVNTETGNSLFTVPNLPTTFVPLTTHKAMFNIEDLNFSNLSGIECSYNAQGNITGIIKNGLFSKFVIRNAGLSKDGITGDIKDFKIETVTNNIANFFLMSTNCIGNIDFLRDKNHGSVNFNGSPHIKINLENLNVYGGNASLQVTDSNLEGDLGKLHKNYVYVANQNSTGSLMTYSIVSDGATNPNARPYILGGEGLQFRTNEDMWRYLVHQSAVGIITPIAASSAWYLNMRISGIAPSIESVSALEKLAANAVAKLSALGMLVVFY